MPRLDREQDKTTLPDRIRWSSQPAATGSSSLRRRYQQPLMTIMVVVVAGAADRLRQHREPAARARARRGGTS